MSIGPWQTRFCNEIAHAGCRSVNVEVGVDPHATTRDDDATNQFSHAHFNPCSSFRVIFARLVRLGLIFSALDGKKSGWRISAL